MACISREQIHSLQKGSLRKLHVPNQTISYSKTMSTPEYIYDNVFEDDAKDDLSMSNEH